MDIRRYAEELVCYMEVLHGDILDRPCVVEFGRSGRKSTHTVYPHKHLFRFGLPAMDDLQNRFTRLKDHPEVGPEGVHVWVIHEFAHALQFYAQGRVRLRGSVHNPCFWSEFRALSELVPWIGENGYRR